MTETVELRNKPELKIILNKREFTIVDAAEPKNSGTYLYGNLTNVRLNAEQTDWFVPTISIITSFFAGGGSKVGNFKNKANLQIEMHNQKLKIWPVDVDFKKAEKISLILSKKK